MGPCTSSSLHHLYPSLECGMWHGERGMWNARKRVITLAQMRSTWWSREGKPGRSASTTPSLTVMRSTERVLPATEEARAMLFLRRRWFRREDLPEFDSPATQIWGNGWRRDETADEAAGDAADEEAEEAAPPLLLERLERPRSRSSRSSIVASAPSLESSHSTSPESQHDVTTTLLFSFQTRWDVSRATLRGWREPRRGCLVVCVSSWPPRWSSG